MSHKLQQLLQDEKCLVFEAPNSKIFLACQTCQVFPSAVKNYLGGNSPCCGGPKKVCLRSKVKQKGSVTGEHVF